MVSADEERRDLASPSPRVSVIMPVHNTQDDYLRKAIASVLCQTLGDFELIIVDDGSDAYVRDCVMSFHDGRIVFHRFLHNLGVVAARNWALDHARGEYVAFLDSDDEALPNRLYKECRYLDANPGDGLVYSNARVVDDHGEELSIGLFEEKPENLVGCMLLKGNCICMSSVMARRALIENCGSRFQKKYLVAQDYALWLSFLGKAGFGKLDDKLVIYRYHLKNTSQAKRHLMMSLTLRAQLDAINATLGLSISYLPWAKAQSISPKRLSAREISSVLDAFLAIALAMEQKGEWNSYARLTVMSKLKNIAVHTHGFSRQKAIWSHQLPAKLGTPFYFKVFCLVTRMV